MHVGIGSVKGIERSRDGLLLTFSAGGEEHTLTVEAVIQAVGWPGNADRLNLAAAGVAVERSYVVVDDTLRTTAPHIFAAGDINGRMMLVQSAGHEARIAAENAVRGRRQRGPSDRAPRRLHRSRVCQCRADRAAARAQHDVVVAEVAYAIWIAP